MAKRLIILLMATLLAGCLTPIEPPSGIPGTLPDGPIPSNITLPTLSQPDLSTPQPPLVSEPAAPGPEAPGVRDGVYTAPSPEDMAIGNQTGGKLLLTDIERGIFDKVNSVREIEGIPALGWNRELLPAARSHSLALAHENLPLTEPALFCKRPFLHHEALEGGLYAIDRLYGSGVYYFASVGENLFIAPTSGESLTYDSPQACPEEGVGAITQSLESLEADYQERLAFVDGAKRVSWAYTKWKPQEEIEDDIVAGWMESPGHLANMVDPGFDEGAVGVAQVNDYLVVTQVFIDRIDCGYLGARCCLDDPILYCYDPWVCSDHLCG